MIWSAENTHEKITFLLIFQRSLHNEIILDLIVP